MFRSGNFNCQELSLQVRALDVKSIHRAEESIVGRGLQSITVQAIITGIFGVFHNYILQCFSRRVTLPFFKLYFE